MATSYASMWDLPLIDFDEIQQLKVARFEFKDAEGEWAPAAFQVKARGVQNYRAPTQIST